jgi:hypothetical protein
MTTKLSYVISWFSTLYNQLRLSISSIEFYQDVYRSYKGYGIQYVFTLSFISSIIYCIFIFNYLLTLKDYFVENRSSNSTKTIEYILKQLPVIYYDGNKILVEQDEPIFLLDENSNKVAVIDTKNQLPYGERIKIPVIFGSNKITVATIEVTDKKKNTFDLEYSKLFVERINLTEEVIKEQCAKILSQALRIFIYLIIPVIVVVRFCTILFEKSFIVLLVYLLTSFLGPKSTVQVCTRMVMFSSGVTILLQPIFIIFIPEYSSIVFFIQMFANLLLFLGMLKIRDSKIL